MAWMPVSLHSRPSNTMSLNLTDAAGSGIGALVGILQNQPDLFGTRALDGDGDGGGKKYTAAEIYSWLRYACHTLLLSFSFQIAECWMYRCYLVTHAHLDHFSGAVLAAGSLPGSPRKVHATSQTLKDIETIFSDRLWPNLASWDESDTSSHVALLYSEYVPPHPKAYVHPCLNHPTDSAPTVNTTLSPSASPHAPCRSATAANKRPRSRTTAPPSSSATSPPHTSSSSLATSSRTVSQETAGRKRCGTQQRV